MINQAIEKEECQITELAKQIGYRGRPCRHLITAFNVSKIHSSKDGINRKNYTNAALATLGDSVIDLILVETLLHHEDKEVITKIKSSLSNNELFKKIIIEKKLYIFLYNDEGINHYNQKEHLKLNEDYASLLEAIIGAIHLDLDYQSAKHYFLKLIDQLPRINFESLLEEFFANFAKFKFNIYNEFSFQHELGKFLASHLTSDFVVRFEYNIKKIINESDIEKNIKHEIDIYIESDISSESYAIELKYPRNGQYPEQMYQFIKDICFMEQVKNHSPALNAYCITLIDDKLFKEGKEKQGIYSYFRGLNNISGNINKPTKGYNEKNLSLFINGSYAIKWRNVNDFSYYILKIM